MVHDSLKQYDQRWRWLERHQHSDWQFCGLLSGIQVTMGERVPPAPGWAHGGTLLTAPDFGCNQYQPKEP